MSAAARPKPWRALGIALQGYLAQEKTTPPPVASAFRTERSSGRAKLQNLTMRIRMGGKGLSGISK